MKYPKKLIEVALPLDDINKACAYEKMPGIGPHPRGLHQWWSRKPLAACRAVLFAQMVNDPGGERGWGGYPGQTREMAQLEREKLFDIIRDLVKWENTNNEELLKRARAEIRKSWEQTCKITGDDPTKLPSFLDPFAGGGSIPLEAQRLGLEAHASDLNPVAVMICKALIEIPPKFSGHRPVGPLPGSDKQNKMKVTQDCSGAKGLAEDVRRYGHWMRAEAFKKIGHLYPQVDMPKEYGGGKANVIAWLWARTVASPNPAYKGVHVPLTSKWWLCNKEGKETWVEPVVASDGMSYRFEVRKGKLTPNENTRVSNGTGFPNSKGKKTKATFQCLLSGTPINGEYIDNEANAGRLGARLMAIVAEGVRGRVYLPPNEYIEMEMADKLQSYVQDPVFQANLPTQECRGTFASNAQGRRYGFFTFKDYFTPRQLVALTTFSDLVLEAREKVIADARAAGWPDDGIGLHDGGTGASAYGDAVAVYLAFAVDRTADFNNSLTIWLPGNEKIMHLFDKQAIPMVWDFGESNVLANVVGGFSTNIEYQSKCLIKTSPIVCSHSAQFDVVGDNLLPDLIVSFDRPYFDNIGYSDLSDFFYVWLKKTIGPIFQDLFLTTLTPKTQELIATPYRHGNSGQPEEIFMNKMASALININRSCHVVFPVTIYYAFKQTETKNDGTFSKGWVAFLDGICRSGFAVTGTWPLRTEQTFRTNSLKSNSLASSIVLVCRKR